MRHSVPKFFLPALAVLLAGALVVTQPVLKASAGFELFHWEMSAVKDTLTTRTYPISGAFTSIEIDETVSDVKIAYNAKGEARVVCREFTNHPHTITVEGGVLKVTMESSDMFYTDDRDPELTLYLPGNQYESLTFASSTGDLETSSQLTFGTVRAETSTGDLEIAGKVTGTLTATASTGDIELKNLQAASIEVGTSTGSIELEKVTADGPVQLVTSTGDVELKDLTAAALTVSTSTGDIEVEWATIRGDASLTTNTGDIELKQYTVMGNNKAESASGRVRTDWDF